METAGDIIKDALGDITVLGAEATLEPTDAQLALRYLNRMMSAFAADGITLGYTKVNNLADPLTVADGALAGITAQLAMMLWDNFSDGQPPPPTLTARALSGKNTMRNMTVVIQPTEFPPTLPLGSGNYDYSGYNDQYFFTNTSDKNEAKLILANNTEETILLGVDTPVVIDGTWITGDDNNFVGDTTGRITYANQTSQSISLTFTLDATVVSGVAKKTAFYLALNGEIVNDSEISRIVTAGTDQTFTQSLSIGVDAGAFLEIFAENQTDATNIIVSSATFEVKD